MLFQTHTFVLAQTFTHSNAHSHTLNTPLGIPYSRTFTFTHVFMCTYYQSYALTHSHSHSSSLVLTYTHRTVTVDTWDPTVQLFTAPPFSRPQVPAKKGGCVGDCRGCLRLWRSEAWGLSYLPLKPRFYRLHGANGAISELSESVAWDLEETNDRINYRNRFPENTGNKWCQ